MSSNGSKTNHFSLRISPSHYLGKLLLFFYSGALLLLWLIPVTVWVALPFSLLLIWDGRRHWRRYASQTEPKTVRQLVWHGENDWSLWRKDGVHIAHLQLLQSVNHPLLIVLNFSQGHHLVLLPDSSNADDLRRLRVLLKEALNKSG